MNHSPAHRRHARALTRHARRHHRGRRNGARSRAGTRAGVAFATIEVTLRTPSSARAQSSAIASAVPEICVGVGTVMSPEDLTLAENAGAAFAISPAPRASCSRQAALVAFLSARRRYRIGIDDGDGARATGTSSSFLRTPRAGLPHSRDFTARFPKRVSAPPAVCRCKRRQTT